MSIYAIVKGGLVDGVTIADAPLETDGKWICIDDLAIRPAPNWRYDGKNFEPPPVVVIAPPEIIIPKTEEEKIAEAAASAVAKLIADGVLKQA